MLASLSIVWLVAAAINGDTHLLPFHFLFIQLLFEPIGKTQTCKKRQIINKIEVAKVVEGGERVGIKRIRTFIHVCQLPYHLSLQFAVSTSLAYAKVSLAFKGCLLSKYMSRHTTSLFNNKFLNSVLSLDIKLFITIKGTCCHIQC